MQTVNVRHHPNNGPRYEGKPADAVVIVHRRSDEKIFTLLVLDEAGAPVLDKAGVQERRTYKLGSTLDEKVVDKDGNPSSCNHRIVIAKADWERVKRQPAVAHWLREGEIDAHSAA